MNTQHSSAKSFEDEVRDRIRDLSLERLSHREIVDRLTEQGYPRTAVIQTMNRMTSRRQLRADLAMPLLIMLICIPIVAWGALPVTREAGEQLKTMKWMALAVGGFIFVPCAFAVLYKLYDQIPGLGKLLTPLLKKRQERQAAIVELDRQFLDGNLPEHHYEASLIEQLGRNHGRSHFLFMRNQKHFGLEESGTAS